MGRLRWGGWVLVVGVGVIAASVTFWGWVEFRQLALERQQLREIVALIQSGRIGVAPAAAGPSAPAGK